MIYKIFSIIVFFLILAPQSSFADTAAESFNAGLGKTGQAAYGVTIDQAQAQTQLQDQIAKVVKIILSVVGVMFLVLCIYGGYKWMLAAGNETQVAEARKIIVNALIGLVVVMAAYAITAFIGKYIQDAGQGPVGQSLIKLFYV